MRVYLDLLILALADARLVRLITHDDLGLWFLREPLYRWAGFDPLNGDEPSGLKSRLVSGLTCPFCVGFWVGIPLLATWLPAAGPGHPLLLLWEGVAGAFALNYLVAHIVSRLDGQAE